MCRHPCKLRRDRISRSNSRLEILYSAGNPAGAFFVLVMTCYATERSSAVHARAPDARPERLQSKEVAMIRDCTNADVDVMIDIINEAALAYRGVIPDDCWHDPYMTPSALLDEI